MDDSSLLERLSAALSAHASGDVAGAEALCRAVLAETPQRPEALTLMGMLRRRASRLDEAAQYYRQALDSAPHYADAHFNLGNLLTELGQTEAALASFERAVSLRPQWAGGHHRLAVTLHALGRFDEAFVHFDRALALEPNSADCRWDHALALLAAGRYIDGWRQYESRWLRGQPPARGFAQPQWTGEALAGKRLLVHAEQGFGDAIQFLRFVPRLKELGAHVILELREPLRPLIDAALGVDEIAVAGQVLPAFDLHVPLLTVPGVLGVALDDLPCAVPYLRVPAERVAPWRNRIGTAGLKVGLVWAGNPNVVSDRWRSPRLEPLKPVLDVPGVRFFALQKGDGTQDLVRIGPVAGLTDLGPQLHDFGDTAAALLQMDLLITTDTSVAHLAGALGRPVWLMLHAQPDWRWMHAGNESPWYPTARLYRQRRLGDWADVAAAVARDLHALAGAEAAIVPTSAAASVATATAAPADAGAVLRRPFGGCPLCGSRESRTLGRYDCRKHSLWHEPLPATLAWRRCEGCGHVHTDGYFTDAGLTELFARAHANQTAGGDLDGQRFVWSRVVERVLDHLPAAGRLFEGSASWLDVGCGAGGLVFTAAEYGFAATGLDARAEAAERLAALGYRAVCGDLMDASIDGPWTVISMADVLEHLPNPRAALTRVRSLLADDGALFLSCPNLDCAAWRAMDAAGTNPYWHELEHLHNFSRARLVALLAECGFESVAYGVSQRYKACMEIVARPARGAASR